MNKLGHLPRPTGRFIICHTLIILLGLLATLPVKAEDEHAAAHAAQNPISNSVSIPFQNSINFRAGPYRETQNVLVVQPVIPFRLNDDWNLITRWITPLISQPRLSPLEGASTGLGNLEPQFYFSPARSGPIIWGFGPQVWLPTASEGKFGVNKWGAGPALAVLTMQGPWVVGILANHAWAGTRADRISRLTLNPFVNFNLPGGWYLSSSPIATAEFTKRGGERWTVPIGGGAGRIFKIDGHTVNARVQAFYNAVRPDFGARWTVQAQIQFLFSK